jgi:hypothetical protein
MKDENKITVRRIEYPKASRGFTIHTRSMNLELKVPPAQTASDPPIRQD